MIYLIYEGCDKMSTLLQRYREDLHQIPEISLKEFKTKEYLYNELKSLGYSPIEVLDTGLLVYIDNNHSETVAFRSDIDALPVLEENDIPFKSKHEGAMHACGHDGHMSMLLGLADYLKDKKDILKKNVLLIFQPAEESIGGAKQICDLGVLKEYKVKAIFGIHLYPELDQGIVASRPGEFMAKASEINIEIHGKTAHGAMPQNGIDSNIILAKMLLEFQNIQTRMLSPLEYSIITFGKIEGGFVRNVISDYARMEGTVRAFNSEVFNKIVDGINAIASSYEALYGCKIDINMTEGYLPVINDEILYKRLQNAVRDFEFYEFPKPLMIAEDFSFYQNEVPGVFYYIGTKNEKLGFINSLHSSKFNFDSQALMIGLETYKKVLVEMEVLNE